MIILSITVHILLKDLHNGTEIKNHKIINHIKGGLIDLINAVNKKNLENGNPDKVIDIVEEILNFNKESKNKQINFKKQGKARPSGLAMRLKIKTPNKCFKCYQ